MSRRKRSREGDTAAFVRCRLCGREYRFINWHLVYTHGWDSPDAAEEYRRRFPTAPLVSAETRRRARASQRRHFERLGRSWTQQRLRDFVRHRRAEGLPLNVGAIERDCETAYAAARHLFGSWKNLIESCGLPYRKIAQRVRWSRQALLDEIRWAFQNGLDMSYAGTLKRDSALLATANDRFGKWSSALKAAGIDPRLAMQRHPWSRASVVRAIRAIKGPLIAGRLPEKYSTLISAAKRHFGGWVNAVRSAGRPYPGRLS